MQFGGLQKEQILISEKCVDFAWFIAS